MRSIATALPIRALLALASLAACTSAAAVDWNAVKPRDVSLFYPGQASWEWVLTAKDHSGATKFREGKNCKSCHDGEQADMGKRIVTGEKLEPKPIANKPGSATVQVRTAHDADRLYFQLRFKPSAPTGTKDDATFVAHVTVMIDDGGVKEATRAGCWASCHDDAIGMASAPASGEITKYLGASRTKLARTGGGENFKPDADLQALMASGTFLEYWQARIAPDKLAQAVSGWILDKRHEHSPAASSATATFADGWWTVELSRPLAAGGTGQKAIAAGKTYTVGFALHDDYANHRHHYVSFEHTLVLDAGTADFVAAKQ